MEDKSLTGNHPKDDTKSQNKKNLPMMMGIKDEILASVIEDVLPKLQPMIAPAKRELEKYLGSDEKLILLSKASEGSSAKVIVIKTDSNLLIQGKKLGRKFTCEKEAIEHVFNVDEFVEMLLTGKLTEFLNDK